MKRWRIAGWLVAACAVSAAAGYWTGFRDGWYIGSAVDLLPRGARSVAHLEAIQAGRIRSAVLGLEFEVDSGLLWAEEVVSHPLRELWRPVWGLEVYPEYERYITRLADYRRDHPSSTRADMFTQAPESQPEAQETLRDFARNARDVAARRDAIVRRYATPR